MGDQGIRVLYLKVAVFFSILFSLTVALQGAAFGAITPVQISSGFYQGRADVSGSMVAWKRKIQRSDGTLDYDIFRHNLTDPLGEAYNLNITDAQPGDQINPVTNGSNIVWEDWRSGHGDIYMSFLGIEQPLVTAPGDQGILCISGDTVVYVSNPADANLPMTDPGNRIYYIDLSDRVPHPIDNGPAATGAQWGPRISGNRVVWMDYRNGNWDIYEKDLPAGPERRLTTNPGDDEFPDISGDIVAWRSYQNGQWDIHWMNLANGVEHAATNDAAYQESVRISGSLLVWMDGRSDPNPASPSAYDLYMEDLNTGVQTKIADRSVSPAYPAIDGSTLVWQEASSRIMEAQVPTSSVNLSLGIQNVYWASDADYAGRLLSIRYAISATPDSAPAGSVQILDSPATSGVILGSSMPVAAGDIQPGQQSAVVLKYLVPVGVSSFNATVYASALSGSGNLVYFPGPPA